MFTKFKVVAIPPEYKGDRAVVLLQARDTDDEIAIDPAEVSKLVSALTNAAAEALVHERDWVSNEFGNSKPKEKV